MESVLFPQPYGQRFMLTVDEVNKPVMDHPLAFVLPPRAFHVVGDPVGAFGETHLS